MLTSKAHGYIDYLTVILFGLAPSIISLSEIGTLLAYTLAVVHLLMTIFTNFSMGLIKIIPFNVHGFVELAVGVVLVAAPWLLADFFSYTDQLFYTFFGIVILAIRFMTDYKSA